MTAYQCSCGAVCDSSEEHRCPATVFTVTSLPSTPAQVGAEIRRLLFSLRHPDDDGVGPWQHYGTETLRAEALDYAGICFLSPGEMAPECTCEWGPDNLNGPRRALVERLDTAGEGTDS